MIDFCLRVIFAVSVSALAAYVVGRALVRESFQVKAKFLKLLSGDQKVYDN